MTNQESGSVRISQQDGTSNPEKLEKQYEVNLFGETELTAYEVEQKIHPNLFIKLLLKILI